MRLLPPSAKERFSTWFRRRSGLVETDRQGAVTLYPTCQVEYHETQIGKDTVRVYEHNGIECSVSEAGCCGAPWLHAGDLAGFTEIAERNVGTLAADIRERGDVVVLQPTCAAVLKRDYAHYLSSSGLRSDAAFVAEHTFDAAEYLMRVDAGADTELDTEFSGAVPDRITYHAACHLRVQELAADGRDLLRLTGADVEVVEGCAGTGATWGFRTENEAIATSMAERLGAHVVDTAGDVVTGDCNLANTAIAEQAGLRPVHPMQVMARAYGIQAND